MGAEKRFEGKLRRVFDEQGKEMFHFKTHGGMYSSGLPDIMGWHLKLGPFASELKAHEKYDKNRRFEWASTTELQLASLKRADESGAAACVLVWSFEARVMVAAPYQVAKAFADARYTWGKESFINAERMGSVYGNTGSRYPIDDQFSARSLELGYLLGEQELYKLKLYTHNIIRVGGLVGRTPMFPWKMVQYIIWGK